jgi:hypothetical protein
VKIRSWLDLAEKTIHPGLSFEEIETLGLRFKPGKDWSGLVSAMKKERPPALSYERMIAVKQSILKDFLEGDLTNESDL